MTSTATSSSPLFGLGSTFIQFTPEWLKHIAIQVFGLYDKVALKAGMGLTLVAVAAILGLIARSALRIAQIAYLVMGLVVAVAVYSRAEASLVDVVPTVIAVAAGLYLLTAMFTDPTDDAGAAAPGAGNRRRFLTLAAGGAGVAVVSGGLSRADPDVGRRGELARRGRQCHRIGDGGQDGGPPDRLQPRRHRHLPLRDLQRRLLPDRHRLHRAAHQRRHLEVAHPRHGGPRDHPDYNDLLARPLLERMVTMTCVSNEIGGDLVGNAVWQGALIRDLLAEAGPSADADMVMSRSSDGFSAGTPLSALTDPDRDAIFAVTMNGEVLPFEHGFPVRMVVPGLYGFVSATKWVVELEVTRFDQQTSYWTDRGWSPEGPIKTASRIDVPKSFQKFPAGKVVMGGVAWAQHRGITSRRGPDRQGRVADGHSVHRSHQ